jgi:hypothetical protein
LIAPRYNQVLLWRKELSGESEPQSA